MAVVRVVAVAEIEIEIEIEIEGASEVAFPAARVMMLLSPSHCYFFAASWVVVLPLSTLLAAPASLPSPFPAAPASLPSPFFLVPFLQMTFSEQSAAPCS